MMFLNCDALEDSWESLGKQGNQILKEINPVILTGRIYAEAPTLWPPNVKSQLIEKDSDAGKDWERRRDRERMVRWHHWLNGHEFEQTPGWSWRKRKSALLQFMELQRVRHDIMTEQQYVSEIDNLKEMDELIEKYLPKPNQKEIENMNRPINLKHWNWNCDKKNLPANKTQGQMDS